VADRLVLETVRPGSLRKCTPRLAAEPVEVNPLSTGEFAALKPAHPLQSDQPGLQPRLWPDVLEQSPSFCGNYRSCRPIQSKTLGRKGVRENK
jgi:hypothetical protein